MKRSYWWLAFPLMLLAILACTFSAETDTSANVSETGSADSTGESETSSAGTSDNNEPAAADENNGPQTNSDNEVDMISNSDLALADPSQVDVTAAWHIDEEIGFLYVYGSVTNHSNTPISGMIRFMYYDASGAPLSVTALEETDSDTVPFSAPIAPGATGYYFRPRDLTKLNGTVANVEASLDYAVLESVSPVAEFSNVQWTNSADGGVDISGRLKNNGATTCNYPALQIAFLRGGAVAGVGDYPLDSDTLPVGSDIEFSFNKFDVPADFDDVQVVIDCSPTTFPRP
jgi:hypothetical protein